MRCSCASTSSAECEESKPPRLCAPAAWARSNSATSLLSVELSSLNYSLAISARALITRTRCKWAHVVVVVAPDVVCELVAEHTAHVGVQPEAVVAVRAEAELDRLACVHVQAEEVRLLVRRELGEEAVGESVLSHDVPDGGVGREPREEGTRGFGAGEVRERLDAVEDVLCVGGCGGARCADLSTDIKGVGRTRG